MLCVCVYVYARGMFMFGWSVDSFRSFTGFTTMHKSKLSLSVRVCLCVYVRWSLNSMYSSSYKKKKNGSSDQAQETYEVNI